MKPTGSDLVALDRAAGVLPEKPVKTASTVLTVRTEPTERMASTVKTE